MSQLGADDFVLSLFPQCTGYFVDVGAADGLTLSNTAKLERAGWRGVAVDPLLKNFGDRKNTVCIQAPVYSQADVEVEFVVCAQDPNFSGVAADLDRYKAEVMAGSPQVFRLKTRLLADVLSQAAAPPIIEFLSLDTEGSEYSILSTFPFDRYCFGVICVEHNFEEPKRSQIRQLLTSVGYAHWREVQWDDWYVHASLVPRLTGNQS